MYTVPKPPTGSHPSQASQLPPADGAPGPVGLSATAKSRLKTKDSVVGDVVFRALAIVCALALVASVGLIFYELVSQSNKSIAKFGFKFLIKTIWDPVAEDFGGLPFIYGTIVSSLVALIIAVPLSLGTALFLTEICPPKVRAVLSF